MSNIEITTAEAARIALSCVTLAILDAIETNDPVTISWLKTTGLSWIDILDIDFKPKWILQIEQNEVNPILFDELLSRIDSEQSRP